jgi:hypothetical protein
MQIELPQDVFDRVKRRTDEGNGITDADVIRRALDSLDWQDQERLAVQVGLDALNAGQVRDFADFDRDFREKNGF